MIMASEIVLDKTFHAVVLDGKDNPFNLATIDIFDHRTNEVFSIPNSGELMAFFGFEQAQEDASSVPLPAKNSTRVSGDHPDPTDRFIWKNELVLLLIDEYQKRKEKFLGVKGSKVILWKEITAVFNKRGYNIDIEVVQRKWRGLNDTFKRIYDSGNAKHTGRGRQSWEFYESMYEVNNGDPSFMPECVVAAGVKNKVTEQKTLQATKRQTSNDADDESDETSTNSQPAPKKNKKLSKGKVFQSALEDMNKNLKQLTSSVAEMAAAQVKRNDLLELLVGKKKD